jgi:hypothetical protein
MILELTPEQTAFQQQIEVFAREVVALLPSAVPAKAGFPKNGFGTRCNSAGPSASCSIVS